MKVLLFTTMLLLQQAGAFAQDTSSIATKYSQRTIYLYGSRYRLNNQVLRQDKLAEFLQHTAEAAPDFELYKTNRRKTAVFFLLGLGTYVAGLTQLDKNDGLALGLMGAGALLHLTVAFPLSIKATKHLQQSVWLYNKSVLQ